MTSSSLSAASSKKKEILGHIGIYSFAEQITQGLALVAGILTRSFLGPIQMGVWSSLNLALEYSAYMTLGTTTATSREIPYYLGKKEEARAEEIKNLVMTFGMLMSLIAASGLFAFTLFYRSRFSPFTFWGLLGMSALIILQRYSNILVGLLRAYKRFGLASKQMIASGIANLIFIAALSIPFKFYGLLVAMILSMFFNIVYIHLHHAFDFKWMLNRRIWGLISFGFPLMILSFSSTLFKSIDKILILRLLGFEQMGYYSIAMMAVNYLNKLPNSMGVIMIPHFQEKYGSRDNPKDLKNYIHHATFAFYSFMPLLIGIAWIVAPLFIQSVLPDFLPGVTALKYLILSTFFYAVSFPYGDMIITLKKHWILLPVVGIFIFVEAALNLIAIQAGWGIAGIAAMTTLTIAFYFMALFVIAGRSLYTFQEGLPIVAKVFARFAFMAAILLLLDAVIHPENPWLRTVFQLGLFCLIQVPFLLKMNEHFQFFQLIRQWTQKIAPQAPLEEEL